MNQQRRDVLQAIAEGVERLGALVEETASEEVESWENQPEFIQDSERGRRSQEQAEELQEIADEMTDIAMRLVEVQS